jgi:CBS domain containing-hemolysin-like protein
MAMLRSRSFRRQTPRAGITGVLAWTLLLLFPSAAHASLLSPELEDKLATFIALFVLFVVPVVLIVLFWLVHILPEKIAHKRQHPQFEAIRTLCLLSLVFGGLLWPLAWIWAYTKPTLYKMAYGRDTVPHDELYPGEPEPAVAALALHQRLASLEGRVPEAELSALRSQLDALETRFGARSAHGAR